MAKRAAPGSGHLYRKKRKGKEYGNYLIRLHGAGGKVRYVNLDTPDYNDASQLYHEWNTQRNAAEAAGGDPNELFLDFIWRWYDERVRRQKEKNDVTPQTLTRYRNFVVAMEAYLRANRLDTLTLADLTSKVFDEFLTWRVKQGRFHGVSKKVLITPAGANREWKFWKALLRQLFLDRVLAKDVTKGVTVHEFEEEREPLPSEEELREVFALIEEPESVEFLVVLANTGKRPGEGMHLHWRDVDFERHTFRIRRDRERGWTPKTKKSAREVPMPEVVEQMFLRMRARRPNVSPDDYVFVFEETGEPFHRHEDLAYKRLEKAVRRANRLRKADGKPLIPVFTIRTLRAWFITWAMTRPENPLAEAEVVKIVGHVDFEMIRKYYFRPTTDGPSAQKMRQGSALGGRLAATAATSASSSSAFKYALADTEAG